jgi:hypothetical protein
MAQRTNAGLTSFSGQHVHALFNEPYDYEGEYEEQGVSDIAWGARIAFAGEPVGPMQGTAKADLPAQPPLRAVLDDLHRRIDALQPPTASRGRDG